MTGDNEGAGPGGGGLLRNPQDFAAGLFLLVFAAVAFFGAWELRFGQLRGIGPGLMPKVTAAIVAAFGVLLVVTSFLSRGSALERWSLRGPFFILGAVLLFALTIRGASFPQFGLQVPSLGLIIAGPMAVIVSAFADRETRPLEVAIYAVVITALCGVLFKDILNLPIPFDPLGIIPDPLPSLYIEFKRMLVRHYQWVGGGLFLLAVAGIWRAISSPARLER